MSDWLMSNRTLDTQREVNTSRLSYGVMGVDLPTGSGFSINGYWYTAIEDAQRGDHVVLDNVARTVRRGIVAVNHRPPVSNPYAPRSRWLIQSVTPAVTDAPTDDGSSEAGNPGQESVPE